MELFQGSLRDECLNIYWFLFLEYSQKKTQPMEQ
ncbi:transposase [Salmonella enterica]|nr:transposase [Salmonella enterica]